MGALEIAPPIIAVDAAIGIVPSGISHWSRGMSLSLTDGGMCGLEEDFEAADRSASLSSLSSIILNLLKSNG